MRGFSKTLFDALLGWIRNVVEGIWNILFTSEAQGWLQWVTDNWLVLVVLLCLAGLVVDFLVWFVRWRPYYVWASSLRRLRRLFGGRGKEEKAGAQAAAPRPARQPLQPLPEHAPQEEQPAWEEEPAWEQEPAWEEPWVEPVIEQAVPAWTEPPAAIADTLLARPRKTDYHEQYVRRFARPEPAETPVKEEAWQPPAAEYNGQPDMPDWEEPGWEEPVAQEEPWPVEASSTDTQQPLHPGIDYRALSLQYGWQAEGQEPQTGESGEDQAEESPESTEKSAAWDFSAMKNFAPYRAPAPVQTASSRGERARKTREGGAPLSGVKSRLGRIAQRAGKALSVDEEDNQALLDGLPPPIDKRRAFHAPVYPNRPGMPPPNNPDFREDD